MHPEIQNIVCTVDLSCTLDLHFIASNGINVEYNPQKFEALTMRIRKPRSSANIFTSGKIVCLGTKDEHSARIACRRFARIIQRLGFSVKFLNFRITNFVASADLNKILDLSNLAKMNASCVDYYPESFPGLIYRDGVTIVVFRSGKVILTNAKSRQQLNDAFDHFRAIQNL